MTDEHRPPRFSKINIVKLLAGLTVVLAVVIVAAVRLNLYFEKKSNEYFIANDLDNALKYIEKAIMANPFSAESYSNRGLIYGHKGKYDKAIADATKAIARDSRFDHAYMVRCMANIGAGKLDNARSDCEYAAALNSNMPYVYDSLGGMYFTDKDYPKAIAAFTRVLELGQRNDRVYLNRGLVYLNNKEYDKSIDDSTMALAINGKNVLALKNRAYAYFQQGKFPLAISDYDKAIMLTPFDPALYLMRAYSCALQKDYNKAREDVKRIEGFGIQIPDDLKSLLKGKI